LVVKSRVSNNIGLKISIAESETNDGLAITLQEPHSVVMQDEEKNTLEVACLETFGFIGPKRRIVSNNYLEFINRKVSV
jgi:hypothetical protein